MDIMQQLQDIFKQATNPDTSLGDKAGNIANSAGDMVGNLGSSLSNGFSKIFGNSGILGPAALGGLIGALLTSKGARGAAGGALLAGGGAALWQKYKERMKTENANNPQYDETMQPTAQDQSLRLIRALVYAAKADGHVDDKEQRLIEEQVGKLNLGGQGQALVKQAMSEPIDPALIARGVHTEDEALQIFTVSCAVLDIDNFMERAYLDQLAKALNIPDDVKQDIEQKINQPA